VAFDGHLRIVEGAKSTLNLAEEGIILGHDDCLAHWKSHPPQPDNHSVALLVAFSFIPCEQGFDLIIKFVKTPFRLKAFLRGTLLRFQPLPLRLLLMLKHRISGLPVVDAEGEFVGIITEGDIFKVLVDFSGISLGKTVLAFRLEDRPASIKEAADAIREHDGRLASILTSYAEEDPGFRKVYFRIRDLPSEKLQALKEKLEKDFELLYVIQDEVDVT